MDLLIDTNVLVDYYSDRESFGKAARAVFAMGLFGDVRLWATSNSMTDVFYILRKKYSSSDIQKSMKKSLEVLNVCSVTSEDVSASLDKGWEDLEDCLVSVCATKIHADFIVSRDRGGFAESPVPEIDPDGLIRLFADKGINYSEIDW